MNRLKGPKCVPGEGVCETNVMEEFEWSKRKDALV